MKRILALSLVALSGLAFTSCSDEETQAITKQLDKAAATATVPTAAPEAKPALEGAKPQQCPSGKTPDGSGLCPK